MDAYEATKIVFQRIQACDPENASKIMGILLIHDHGEKEMIRLALGPEASVHSVIHKARKELSLSSPSTPSTPSPPSPFSNPMSLSRQNSCSSVSSRLLGGVNINLPSPLSITKQSSAAASSWSNSSFSDFQASDDLVTASFYSGSSPSDMNSSAAAPFHANRGEVDLIDELQLQAQLSFLNDGQRSLGPKNPDFFYHQQQDLASSPSGDDALLFPSYASNCGVSATVNGLPHRRSFSISDICMGPSDDLSGG